MSEGDDQHHSAGVGRSSSGDGAAEVFFPVGVAKLAALSFCTLGLYNLYWSYMNFKLINGDTRMRNLVLACFYPFSSYLVFRQVRAAAARLDPPLDFAAFLMAASVLCFLIVGMLPWPYGFVYHAQVLPFLFAQAFANKVNREVVPNHDGNTRLSAANMVVLSIGSSFLVLAVVGFLLDGRN